MKQKSLKLNALLNTINTVLSLIFPLITFPYSSRILGPGNIGKINFSQSIVSYFVLLAGAGVGTYGIREISKLRDNTELLSKTGIEIFLFNMITTVISYICFFLAVMNVYKLQEYRGLLYIISCSILFGTLSINWLYVGLEEYGYITIRSITFQILSLILLFCFVKNRNDYVLYAWLIVIANGGSSICNFIHARNFICFRKNLKLNIFKHVKPLSIFFVTAISVTLHTLIDQTMIGFLVDDKNVGLYAAAIKIVNMIIGLIVSVSGVLFPRLSYLAERDKASLYELLSKIVHVLIILSLPFVFGLFLESENIIYIICGEEYKEATKILQILSILLVAVVFTNLIGNQVFVSINKEKWLLLSTLIGLVFNIVMNSFFITRYHALGAAIATVISEFIVLFVQVFLFIKEIKLKMKKKLLFYIFVDSFIMSLFVFYVKNLIKIPALSFIVSVFTGVIIYLILLILERNEYLLEILRPIKKYIKN